MLSASAPVDWVDPSRGGLVMLFLILIIDLPGFMP